MHLRRSERLNKGAPPSHLEATLLAGRGRGRHTPLQQSINESRRIQHADVDAEGASNLNHPLGHETDQPHIAEESSDACQAGAVVDDDVPESIIRMSELLERMEEMRQTMDDTRLELAAERRSREHADEARRRAERELCDEREQRESRASTTSLPSTVLSSEQRSGGRFDDCATKEAVKLTGQCTAPQFSSTTTRTSSLPATTATTSVQATSSAPLMLPNSTSATQQMPPAGGRATEPAPFLPIHAGSQVPLRFQPSPYVSTPYATGAQGVHFVDPRAHLPPTIHRPINPAQGFVRAPWVPTIMPAPVQVAASIPAAQCSTIRPTIATALRSVSTPILPPVYNGSNSTTAYHSALYAQTTVQQQPTTAASSLYQLSCPQSNALYATSSSTYNNSMNSAAVNTMAGAEGPVNGSVKQNMPPPVIQYGATASIDRMFPAMGAVQNHRPDINQQMPGVQPSNQQRGAEVPVAVAYNPVPEAMIFHPQQAAIFTQHRPMELPTFSGAPEEWPAFFASYTQSTASFGYTTLDNLYRLQRSLSGVARKAVEPLLIHHENVERVMATLAFRFGRSDLLAQSQLSKVRSLQCFEEQQIEQLVPFATTVENLVAFLRAGQCEDELANPSLLRELVGKLPMSRQIEWTQHSMYMMPKATIVQLSQWLNVASQYVSLTLSNKPTHHQQQSQQRAQRSTKDKFVMHIRNEPAPDSSCAFCTKPHDSADCDKLRDWSVDRRWDEVKRLRLCFSCLCCDHAASTCPKRRRCVVDNCRQSHHPLLHNNKASSNEHATQVSSETDKPYVNPFGQRTTTTHDGTTKAATPDQPTAENAECSSAESRFHVTTASSSNQKKRELPLLFKIVPVVLRSKTAAISTFAFVDDGADVSMIDADLAVELGLRGVSTSLDLKWIGDVHQTLLADSVSFEISAAANEGRRFQMEGVRTVKKIDLPMQTINIENVPACQRSGKRIPVREYANASPKVLLGLDYAHLAAPISTVSVRGSGDGPTVFESDLGWIVYGKQVPVQHATNHESHCMVTRLANDDAALEQLVREYYTTESFGVKAVTKRVESLDDERARSILAATTQRIGDRYQTGLIWRNDDVSLPESYGMALRRLITVERKMAKDPTYAALYCANMDDYVAKGYARRLSAEEVACSGPRTWYLPHFGVLNAHKPGKLRMVFDAAACVDGVSLNSMLLPGPDENPPLLGILFKFRVGAVAVCGDIKEMFHQIQMQPSDRDAQRFLWRGGDSSRPPDVYEMVAMTFGATCSPAAAQFAKNLNADEHAATFPAAVEPIKCLHYVDDYVASFATTDEAVQTTRAVIEVHRRGGFELRNFVSSDESVLKAIGVAADDRASIPFKPNSSTTSDRILGMCWNKCTDEFTFQPNFTNFDAAVLNGDQLPTKRQVLSITMSVFDPFGYLADFLLHAKLFIQDLWRAGSGWDEPIPQSFRERWFKWCSQLESLSSCRVARCYAPQLKESNDVEIHVFADASEEAFAAIAYWRVKDEAGIVVSFIAAKTKCAPLKLLSVPRLELQAAVLATRLLETIRACHDIDVRRTILWTDSKTVMQWIHSDHRRYKPFVAHRVAEILDTTTMANWRWLPTSYNVADDATRATAAPKFDNQSRFLRGPPFLHCPEEEWPASSDDCNDTIAPSEELRPRFVGLTVSKIALVINLDRFSFYGRLRRAMAWVIRYAFNLRAKVQKREVRVGELGVAELQDAELLMCRLAQNEAFPDEYAALVNKRTVDNSSPICSLMPYVDERGTMRIYGRTDAADATYLSPAAKRPILLPKHHRLTWLIVDYHHRRMCHQNDNAIMCAIRETFWVPHLRSAVRKARHECQMCKLRHAQPSTPVMGQLPYDRLAPYIRPFSYTGIDFFGPLFVTVGRRQEKRWAALFTCLTVRAVHIELAADLSTDACILCIRNFANIRGVPQRIRSDNGTNFIGASKIVRDSPDFFDDVRLRREMGNMGIEWLFNSPGHPEAGGCWERLVRCVKRVLVTTLTESAPRVETLRTLLIEAANIVNSRPLTHVPVSPLDEAPLTPNHFLIGATNSTTVPSELDREVTCMRKQARIAEQLTSRFWSQWVRLYLPELTRRTKWHQERPPVQVGDLVLVCDSNQSRNEWRRGRIVTIFPGPDGRIRNAEVKTTLGMLRRPVSKLAVLDVDIGDEPSGQPVHGGGNVTSSHEK